MFKQPSFMSKITMFTLVVFPWCKFLLSFASNGTTPESTTMSTKKKPNLTTEQVNAIIGELLDDSHVVDGERSLASGARKKIQTKFGISTRQVSRLWSRAIEKIASTGTYSLSPAKKSKVGRPLYYDRDVIQDEIDKLEYEKRGSIRDLADGLGVSRHTVATMKKEGVIKPHSTAIKPMLNDEQMFSRVLYAVERLVEKADGSFEYDAAYNEVYLDEKWFFICPESRKVYLSEKEKAQGNLPKSKAKSKRHMMKVMFLCAVARPRFKD